jgi:hypothetical protein
MARVVLAVAAPVVVKPAMELKKASTGPMTPARRNGAAPTNTTPNQHTTTMRKMLCLDTYPHSAPLVMRADNIDGIAD